MGKHSEASRKSPVLIQLRASFAAVAEGTPRETRVDRTTPTARSAATGSISNACKAPLAADKGRPWISQDFTNLLTIALRNAPSPADGSKATISANRFSGRYPARSKTSSTIQGLVYTTPATGSVVERVASRLIISSCEQFKEEVSIWEFLGGIRGEILRSWK